MPHAAVTAPAPTWLVLAVTLVGVVGISFAAVFFRLASPTHPLVAAAIRLAVAGLVLSPLIWRAWRRQALPPAHLQAGLVGGLLLAVHYGAWVWSLALTSVAASVTLVTATPILLGCLGLLSGRDRPTPRLWLALATASAGVWLITRADFQLGPRALLGDALALFGALVTAFYLLLVRRYGKALDAWAFLAVAALSGSACLYLAAWAIGAPLLPPHAKALGYLVATALVSQIMGMGALTWVLRHTTPTFVGIATLVEPVGASLLAWLWLGEALTPSLLAGGLVVLTGVALAIGHAEGPAPVEA